MKIEKTKIIRVTPQPVEKTYNMTMRGPFHNYFANGILTANSHSVSYGLLAYHTAYLKAHYPAHFWAAVLSNEIDSAEKVSRYIDKAKQMGIEILPPDVNISYDAFTPQGSAIRFGLAAIKGLGQAAVSAIVAARESGGPFKSIYDFTERVEARSVNKRVLESLIKAGAFDSLKKSDVTLWRARLCAAVDTAIESGARAQRDRSTGQVSLFGMMEAAVAVAVEPELPNVAAWSQTELLNAEKETLGFYITGHPLEGYQGLLTEFSALNVDQLKVAGHGSSVKIGGIIGSITVRTTKKGDRFALFQLEDQFGAVKVVVWPELYGKIGGKLKAEEVVLVQGRLEVEEEGAMSIIAEEVEMLDGIRERNARRVLVRFKAEMMTREKIEKLYELLDGNRGEASVAFEVELPEKIVVGITPSPYVTIKPSAELMASITSICGDCHIDLKR